MTTDRKPEARDIGALLTLRNDRGALFRGTVSWLSETGAWQFAHKVDLGQGRGWEPIKPPELRFVRGAEVVE